MIMYSTAEQTDRRSKFKIMSLFFALALMISFSIFGKSEDVYADSDDTSIPVYRLYTSVNGEHLYTTDENEVSVLMESYGWTYEGIGWYAPKQGKPVYRLYNAGLKNHLYTTDTNEVNVLTSKHGWVMDNNGKPLFYSGGTVGIYRLYNAALSGMHLLTTDGNEYNVLPSHGWQKEGTKLYCVKKGSSNSPIPNNPKYVDEVIRLVNVERKKQGLPELKKNVTLCNAANVRANEIIGFFSHTRPDGTSCFSVLSQFNITNGWAGENIAWGQRTPEQVVTAWMNSQGHRENILSPYFTDIGIGAVYFGGCYHWVQLFIESY